MGEAHGGLHAGRAPARNHVLKSQSAAMRAAFPTGGLEFCTQMERQRLRRRHARVAGKAGSEVRQ
jgi:hypothetical protein